MASSVTVICTFLNAEETLTAALESLHRQGTSKARFILVDDGSTDRSATIAASYCQRDSRFSLHHNSDPGRGRALNLGVARSNAEYIAILDADDVAHPAWLEDGLVIMRQRREFAVLGFDRIHIRDGEQPIWGPVGTRVRTDIRDVTRGLARANLLAHSGVIIRRKLLVGVGGYDAARRRLYDYDLWIRLAQAGQRLAVSRLVRIAKRYHAGQKFAHSEGYSLAAWREQFRAIMVLDRDYRNFLRLGLRVAADVTRRPRRTLSQGMKRN